MLTSLLSDIPSIVLLRDDKILHELVDLLINRSNPRQSNALMNGVRDFEPNRFRRNDLEAAVRSIFPYRFTLDYNFDFLDDVFDRYFQINGSLITAQESSATAYSSLVRFIHPFNIIGYRLARLLMQKSISFDDVKLFAAQATPLAITRRSLSDDYADNHIHLGGSNETPASLLDLANRDRTVELLYERNIVSYLPRIHNFTSINECRYTIGQLVDLFKELHVAINRYVLFGDGSYDSNINVIFGILIGRYRHTITTTGFNLSFLEKVSPIHIPGTSRELLLMTVGAFSRGEDEKAWFAYNILLHYLHHSPDTPVEYRRFIKIFIHLGNILRSYMVMAQNKGLSHFVEFFNSPVRKSKRNSYRNIARNIVLNGTNRIEGKISPDAVTSGEYWKYIEAFNDAAVEERRVNGHINPESRQIKYHFCVHFIRKQDSHRERAFDGLRFPPRHFDLRIKVREEAIALDRFLNSTSFSFVSFFDLYRVQQGRLVEAFRDRDKLSRLRIDLPCLVVSLDVAGDENCAPPEVYAPMIRYLRREVRSIPTNFAFIRPMRRHHKKLRLSVHAGEDFNHIVSGMRKIDETVRFYEMAEQDRLGHALALGINPKEWSMKTGEIFLTAEEYLDNLVWLWHYGVEIGENYPAAIAFSKKYEQKIAKLVTEIYGTPYSPHHLFEAWQLRKNCPLEEIRAGNSFTYRNDDRIRYAIPDFTKHGSHVSEEAHRIFESYHRNGDVFRNGRKTKILQYSNQQSKDDRIFFSDAENDFLEALQDFLITRFNERGIIIEANPSSNVFIADIDSFGIHPIFRWYPPKPQLIAPKERFNRFGLRKGPIKVCINTDDPAVFATTLQNEFRLIKKAAQEEFECSEIEAEEWIERIRKIGVQIFEKNHLSPYL